MKKQTISKIAAIALAAMTVVPAFGVTASADIIPRQGSEATTRGPELTGTAYYLEWTTTENTEVFTVTQDTVTGLLTKSSYTSTQQHFVPDTAIDTSYVAAGSAYYGYAATKPADYQALVDHVKTVNDGTKIYKAGIDKAIANFNKDYTALKNAKTSQFGKSGFYTYTDSLGRKVAVNGQNGAVLNDGDGSTAYEVGLADYAWDASGVTVTLAGVVGQTKDLKTYTVNGIPVPKTMAQLADELRTSYVLVADGTGIIEKAAFDTVASTGKGKYYINENATVPANGNTSGSGTTTTPGYTGRYLLYYTTTYCYYSTSTGRYYASPADAALDGVYDTKFVTASVTAHTCPDYSTSVSAAYPWVAGYPNRYYKTEADAKADAAYHGYSTTAVNYYTSYYNNPYGYLYGYNYGYGTTTATKDTSTVTIGKYTGWTYVTRTINAARSGASYTVKMNTETEIPATVLRALYGKNVTINFKFDSGATLSIKGTDMTSASAISTNIRYVKNVPTTLVKKAVSSNSGISSAQFSVSGGSLGADASVTVKFGTNRAGRTATLYRYNASANSLTKVSTSTVKSNGYCTLGNVVQGGDYVIVLS